MTRELSKESTEARAAVEAVLTELTRGAGASPEKLMSADAAVLREFAQLPQDWSVELQARALLQVITEVVSHVPDPKQRAATQVALGLDPAHPGKSANQRLLSLTPDSESTSGNARKIRDYWYRARAPLAVKLIDKLSEVNGTEGWSAYKTAYPVVIQEISHPLFFERYDILYRFSGRTGIGSISYRWAVALQEHVRTYRVVGWYYNDPYAPISFRSLANCRVGRSGELPLGGRFADLEFMHNLSVGERYFFASETEYNTTEACKPIVSHQVSSQGIKILAIRVQFDPEDMPKKVWAFDIALEAELASPQDAGAQLIRVSPGGYVDHEFTNCHFGRRYGFRWEWPGNQ